MYLTRDQILAAEDLPAEDVDVPEWGGVVRVRGLNGTERDAFEASVVEQRGKKTRVDMANFRAKLSAKCLVDADGQRLFSERDVGLLGRKSAAALQRVFEVAQRLSGLSNEDVEELVENFEIAQSDDSGSD